MTSRLVVITVPIAAAGGGVELYLIECRVFDCSAGLRHRRSTRGHVVSQAVFDKKPLTANVVTSPITHASSGLSTEPYKALHSCALR